MTKVRKLTTEGVIGLYLKERRRPRLTIQKLDKNDILIEGNAKALEFSVSLCSPIHEQTPMIAALGWIRREQARFGSQRNPPSDSTCSGSPVANANALQKKPFPGRRTYSKEIQSEIQNGSMTC
jgi:hypothetical protein